MVLVACSCKFCANSFKTVTALPPSHSLRGNLFDVISLSTLFSVSNAVLCCLLNGPHGIPVYYPRSRFQFLDLSFHLGYVNLKAFWCVRATTERTCSW